MQSGMPVPSGPNAFAYDPVPVPILSENPAKARPIGVGPVSIDHDLTLQIGLEAFVSRVDIYLIMYMPALSDTFFFFQPDGSLAPFPTGFKPWKSGKTETVKNNLLGTIPLYLLPSGDYVFFLLAIPKGTPPASLGKNFYLWTTTVENLRVSDMANRAAYLGGDAKAAATIIMALGRDYPLKTVADAVMAGKLKKFGEIVAGTTKALRISDEDLPDICKEGEDVYDCRVRVAGALRELGDQMDDALERWNKAPAEFERFITAYTLYLAGLGYSGEQINEAIQGTLFGSYETKMTFSQCPPGFPIGGIRRFDASGCTDMVDPAVSSCSELISDMDPDDFASGEPGTEGMTFPAYYKGLGTATLSYSHEYYGGVECSMEKITYVARVGGGGYWDGRLKVYAENWPGYGKIGDEYVCDNSSLPWKVVEGHYREDGEYQEDINTEIIKGAISGAKIVRFNKHGLWGGVIETKTQELFMGTAVTEKEWYFDLYECTEAEFNAVANK